MKAPYPVSKSTELIKGRGHRIIEMQDGSLRRS